MRTDPVVWAPRAMSSRAQALLCQPYRNPVVPCRDTKSMSRPKLSRDLERQVTTWEPLVLSKSVATENSLSRQDSPVVHAWPVLSRAHGLFFVVASSVVT